jgi:hypothetical protein
MGGWARAEAAEEHERFGVKSLESLDYLFRGPVGIEGTPRLGGVEVVVRLAAVRDCEGESTLVAEAAQVFGKELEGILALQWECLYQEGNSVGHMAARGTAAARPWSSPLDSLRNYGREGTVECRRTWNWAPELLGGE